jgi:hypothetical protein
MALAHFPGCARKVHPAERVAMHPDARLCQDFDRGAHVHCVAAQAIQLGDDEHVILLHPVQQLGEAFAFCDGDAELNPEAVARPRALNRFPVDRRGRSLRDIAGEMVAVGHVTSAGAR